MAWTRAMLNTKSVSVTACPPAGELDGPEWEREDIKCGSCGRDLGKVQIRRGRARLTIKCFKCRRTSEPVFPREWGPAARAPAVIEGIAGTQVVKCPQGHPVATVEQAPEGVDYIWKLDGRCCPECLPRRSEPFRWPPGRERRLTSTR